jgi:hypothetical protein
MLKRSFRERFAAEEKVQRFLAIARYEHIVRQLSPLQRMQRKVHVVLIVLYQQFVQWSTPPPTRRRGGRPSCPVPLGS